ncbi:MAG TPA: SanA protein, partial [Myxococcaceae bacterium]|nr:SanA protein [Myxococcaceae bacterium]
MGLPAFGPGTMGRGGKRTHPLRVVVRTVLALGLAAVGGVWALSTYVETRYEERILPRAKVSPRPVALVYGAGLAPGAVPSPVLAQRLDTAIALYH